ncbi:GNAT family N-acetyltransferase [Bacillus lacus]|uniref:GNAT family N-acetyltransferase n=1 Tax=Metabacillus lacus TaxID=1983721 RepID=A0A7X2J242_9BACI|nr:GNAT family N-acetyltransferase [Metabacillus lacus]MRX74057.1 GNAT family N-acetyltransferase [Metabacillus lacus]
MTDWYAKLTDYFPANEMKSKEHMEKLFADKQENYLIEEGPESVLIYLEKSDFIFIDYILISGKVRGKGLGGKLIEKVKNKDKAIILEVDPIDPSDADTAKRVNFYKKNGFRKVSSIEYKRIHAVTNELNEMDIYCWSQIPQKDEWVYRKMQEAYQEVHAYKARDFYGKQPQETSEVLTLKKKVYSKA